MTHIDQSDAFINWKTGRSETIDSSFTFVLMVKTQNNVTAALNHTEIELRKSDCKRTRQPSYNL